MHDAVKLKFFLLSRRVLVDGNGCVLLKAGIVLFWKKKTLHHRFSVVLIG